jgi:hypothetical protein
MKCYEKFHLIADTHGFVKDDFNPCFHERYVGVYNDFPFADEWTDSRGFIHSLGTTFQRSLNDPIVDCRNIPLPIGQWLQDFSARAEYHYTTLVDTEASLVNFVIEAIELLDGNVNILKRLEEGILNSLKAFRRHFKETGNFWLSWNFAIRPTINDLKALSHTFEKAVKRLAWLRARNHKDTKVKYRESPRTFEINRVHFEPAPIVVTQPYFNPTPDIHGVPPDEYWQEWADWLTPNLSFEADCSAEVFLSSWAWIRFDIPDYLLFGRWQDTVHIVENVMQGLYNPLQIAWEAVPFSWLIDWFRTESHRLRELLKSDLSPFGHATIRQAGWTIKVNITGTFFALQSMTVGEGALDDEPSYEDCPRTEVGAFRYHVFNRQPGLPEISSFPFRIPIEWYNASILLSLIQQGHNRRE